MATYARSTGWGFTGKKYKGKAIFYGDENVLYLDCSGGSTCAYIFQNPSPAQLKCIHLITYKLYFNNFD